MLANEHKQTLPTMRQELALIETHAKRVSLQFQNLAREIESSKMQSLQKLLEQKIKSEARRRGVASVMKDRSRLRTGILFTVGSFIAGGLLTKDKGATLDLGLAGIDGTLQGFGRSRWVVQLGERIVVAACDSTPQEGNWLSWESLKLALEELQNKALSGEALGNLDDILQRLKQREKRRFFPVKLTVKQPESK